MARYNLLSAFIYNTVHDASLKVCLKQVVLILLWHLLIPIVPWEV